MRTNRDQERKAAKAMGIGTSIFSILFLIFWCIVVASMRAWFMLLFAIPTMGFLVFRLVIMLRQDKKKDPWEMPHRRSPDPASVHSAAEDVFERVANRGSEDARSGGSPRFCHSCSYWVHNDFQFCPRCGRRIF